MTCSSRLQPRFLEVKDVGAVMQAESVGRKMVQVLFAGVVAVTLAACSGLSRTDRPAEVEERDSTRPRPGGSSAQIAAYTPPAQPRIARPAPKRAVEVLMLRAEDQQRAGDLDAATVSLERALRISPDDAVLWHRLAKVRMAQRRPDLVTQLAAKSNALASPDDRELRSSNWHLIAQAKRSLGDSAGARDAERRAATLK